tara:strand:+ start:140 stop:2782 length:2643 start_codon:yes stop_codon:yes gene_type:complete
MASFNEFLPRNNKMFLDLVSRFIEIFKGNDHTYILNATCIFDTEPSGKTKQKGFRFCHSEGNYKGPRTLENPGRLIDGEDYVDHLFYMPGSNGPYIAKRYIVRPPMTADFTCHWGALDVDLYNDKKKYNQENTRIVKQIYDEKLPLIPVFSKSKGLHLFLFAKDYIPVPQFRGALEYYRDLLKLSPKTELFPKQVKQEFEEDYPTLPKVGNGIQLPYGGSFYSNEIDVEHHKRTQKPGNIWAKREDPGILKEGWHRQNEEMIINEALETTTLDKFIEAVENNKLEKDYFTKFPLLKLNENTAEEPDEEQEEGVSNDIPLSSHLDKILNNILNKKTHDRGGSYDNHILDFVYGSVQDQRTDKEILNDLEKVKHVGKDDEYKGGFEHHIKEMIGKCRSKYKVKSPEEKRINFHNKLTWLMDVEKFHDANTNETYGEKSVEMKYCHILPKGTNCTSIWKKNPDKRIAEGRKYRPKDHSKKDNLFRDENGKKYLNTFQPGPLEPKEFKDRNVIERFLFLINYLAPDPKHADHIIKWLASVVQNRGTKIRHVILICSKAKQIGKGTLFRIMKFILGEDNVMQTDIKNMKDKGVMFTDRELVLIDECADSNDHRAKRDLVNELKPIITETKIMARRMRVDSVQVENNPNFLIFTNEKDSIAIDKFDERYFAILHEAERLDHKWYKEFHDWIEGDIKGERSKGIGGGCEEIYYYLKNLNMEGWDPMATAPQSEFKAEMGEMELHPLTKKLKELIAGGYFPFRFGSDLIGSYELSEWGKNSLPGKLAGYINDTKQLKKSLTDAGCVCIGQVLHKFRNEKPTLWVVRNFKKYEAMKKSEICNDHWRPIDVRATNSEIAMEQSSERFQQRTEIQIKEYEEKMGFKNETNI